MAVFNKKNAIIGWAVIEGARLAAGRRDGSAESVDEKKPKRARKALAAATGAAVAAGSVVVLRRRKGTPDTEA